MTPNETRQLAEFLPTDWEGLGPSIVRPAPSPTTSRVRAYNPVEGRPPTVATPLTLDHVTADQTTLLVHMRYDQNGMDERVIWIIDLSETVDGPFDVKLTSSILWGRLARLLGSDLLERAHRIPGGAYLLLERGSH